MISIIIPSLNAEGYIERLISSLLNQSSPCEIIVVDSSSTDSTTDIAQSKGAHLLIPRCNFGHGRTRNLAASQAIGSIIVFLTQDALPQDEHCIANLIRPLGDSEIIASYGRQIPSGDASPLESFARLFNYPDQPVIKGLKDLPHLGIKTFFFSNVCSAIKVKEFNELGGFPENIIMFEDLIFAAKAILNGYKIAYVPEAKVWHSHNFSLVQQFRRYQDAGISLRNNAWIFEHAKANREGAEFLKQEIAYLSKEHQYQWIPYAIAESVFRI